MTYDLPIMIGWFPLISQSLLGCVVRVWVEALRFLCCFLDLSVAAAFTVGGSWHPLGASDVQLVLGL